MIVHSIVYEFLSFLWAKVSSPEDQSPVSSYSLHEYYLQADTILYFAIEESLWIFQSSMRSELIKMVLTLTSDLRMVGWQSDRLGSSL